MRRTWLVMLAALLLVSTATGFAQGKKGETQNRSVQGAVTSASDAPVAGAVKVTVTPLTGLPPPSLTITCKGTVNTVFTDVFCGVPAVGAMVPLPPCSAAALIVTLEDPELITHETVNVWPAEAAL